MTPTDPGRAATAAPLVQDHLAWGAEALWERLAPLLPGLSVEVVARADSTNTRLLERLRHGTRLADAAPSRPGALDALDAPDARDEHHDAVRGPRPGALPHGRRSSDIQPCLLVAEHQTRGRGRLGRDWHASPGASLTFSLALPLAPADWSGLSLAVGLALAQALEPLADDSSMPRLQLKWPNDLWLLDPPASGAAVDSGTALAGRKLGGILIETLNLGAQRFAVVGVGLNVLPQPAAFTAGLDSGFACLSELQPGISAPQALHRVAEPLVRMLLRFQAQGFAPLVNDYARRDLLSGRMLSTSLPTLPQGLACGVDARGALRLQLNTAEGGTQLACLSSGEVSVRPQRKAP